MFSKKHVLLLVLVSSLTSTAFSGCGGSANESVTFSQLISRADKYNGKTVTLEAFYFSGFEISAISGSVGPSSSGVWRIVPTGTLVWVAGGISQELQDKLYAQSETPSGYTERVGKLKITGKFETGGKYGHLDAYQYRITITSAELLEWTPPPAATSSTVDQQPIEIISVLSPPVRPGELVNPGGPVIEITVKNVSVEPVVSLTAILETSRSFQLTFNVYPSNPLLPDQTFSQKFILIGGGYGENIPYPLTIKGTLQNGATFAYTKQIQIVNPLCPTPSPDWRTLSTPMNSF